MASYYIEVEGRPGDAVLSRLPTLLCQHSPTGAVLHGELPDQAALLGALTTLDLLGFRLVAAGLVSAEHWWERHVPYDLL